MDSGNDLIVLEVAGRMGKPELSELVNILVNENGMRFNDAVRTVYLIWKRGRVNLTPSRAPTTVLEYTLAPTSLWFWIATCLDIIFVLLLLFTTTPPFVYLRYAIGVFFVLYMPGSMLIEALYSKADDLEILDRTALSIGLSLTLVPLMGIALNYTPWGIRLEPIIILLAAFTEIVAIVALVRKYRHFRLGLEG